MRNAALLALASAFFATELISAASTEENPPDYARQIMPIFRKYCMGCHNAKDREGNLDLQTYAGLMRGGENGAVVVPKKSARSRLMGVLDGTQEPSMPPEGNKGPTKAELALLKRWIDAGAPKPVGLSPDDLLVVPKIKPAGPVRRSVSAVALSPDGRRLAAARYGRVEIYDTQADPALLRTLGGLRGTVNDVVFSRDGRLLAAGSGEPGLYGEVTIWNTQTWKVRRRIRGHNDAVYAVALSPDGRLLATGSYDQKIKLWDVKSGKELRQLNGHNGPVHDLDFHPRGKVLASASGDRTVKLWDVTTGRRLDTLSQPEKDQYTVAFSPDGRFFVAGGVDNRIRVWAMTAGGKEGTNPLLFARFAHEGPILRLFFTRDGKRLLSASEDRTVKIWSTGEYALLKTLPRQSDWVTGLAVGPDNRTLWLGRMDGTLSKMPLSVGTAAGNSASPILLPPIPQEPKGPVAAPRGVAEHEPNNTPRRAQRVKLPALVRGVLYSPRAGVPDADIYRIRVRQGETWVFETNAARSKSPADTKIEVLHADGQPVLRYLLRAVRDSYITFRPIDSSQDQVRLKNWEEMDLNQYLYMAGEVGRLFRRPRGPDSGFSFYTNRGKRRCYFGTSAVVHAKDEPVYIVQAYPPGTKLADNGLPVFPLYYINDDDAERELGTDSRLLFTAPRDGEYLVRVTDTRGFGGKTYRYQLTMRRARPDFRVTLAGHKGTVPAGSGHRLTVQVDRIDGFTGEIRIDIAGLPRGFTVTSPIIVEADHLQTFGVIHVAPHITPTVPAVWGKPKSEKARQQAERKRRSLPVTAPKPIDWSRVKVTASAFLHGRKRVKDLGSFGPVHVAPRPKVLVYLEPDPEAKPNPPGIPSGELVIAPGSTITAMLRIERNGYQGELKFDVDHLPHGIIVDNIGLNGILIRAGENKRRIYLTASEWVKETTRQIHAVALGQGNQASRPLVLHVRRP